MHVIGKRSRSCCTMRESISSNTAKKAPCTSVKHWDTFCEFVCPQKKQPDGVVIGKEAWMKPAVCEKK